MSRHGPRSASSQIPENQPQGNLNRSSCDDSIVSNATHGSPELGANQDPEGRQVDASRSLRRNNLPRTLPWIQTLSRRAQTLERISRGCTFLERHYGWFQSIRIGPCLTTAALCSRPHSDTQTRKEDI